jgi:hypothetical protein
MAKEKEKEKEKEFIVRYHMLAIYESKINASSRTEAYVTAAIQLARGEDPNADIVTSGRLTILNVRFADEEAED